jgi:hypothetical protein
MPKKDDFELEKFLQQREWAIYGLVELERRANDRQLLTTIVLNNVIREVVVYIKMLRQYAVYLRREERKRLKNESSNRKRKARERKKLSHSHNDSSIS